VLRRALYRGLRAAQRKARLLASDGRKLARDLLRR